MRDEAYVWSANNHLIFLDPDQTVLEYMDLPGNACSSIDVDSNGIVVALYAGYPGGILKVNADMTTDSTFFVMTGGWNNGGGSIKFSCDDQYVFAMVDSGKQLYQFDANTGTQNWKTSTNNGHVKQSTALWVDYNNNAYVQADGYIQKYAVNGTFIEEVHIGLRRCLYYDEIDNRIYTSGTGAIQLYSMKWSGEPDTKSFSIGSYVGNTIWNFVKSEDYIYAVGTRTQGGVGGAYATVWMLDEDLNLIASYDTGYTESETAQGVLVDHDGNIDVLSGNYVGGQDNAGIWVFDTDLNYINDYRANTDVSGADGAEGVKIPYLDDGTPGTDGYWLFYNSVGGAVDFSHLIGETVCILADGVVYPSQVVDDNGHIDATAFSTATNVHIGLNYVSKLAPMKPMSQPDMMKKKATCKQMGISVHNTDDSNGRADGVTDTGVRYGVNDNDMKEINFNDPEWKNKSAVDGLFTGTVAVHVPDGFGVNMPLQITTNSPLPATVRAMIPKVDITGT